MREVEAGREAGIPSGGGAGAAGSAVLRLPPRALLLVAGVPGAGKTTLLALAALALLALPADAHGFTR